MRKKFRTRTPQKLKKKKSAKNTFGDSSADIKVESEDIDLGEPSSVEAEEEVVHITGEAEGVYKVPQI